MQKLFLSIACIVSAAGLAHAQQPGPPNPQDIIVARQAGYSLMGAVVGDMKGAVASGADVKQFSDPAKAIAFWSQAIPGLFPAGTETGHDTKAKPEVWSDRAGFIQAADKLTAAATKLADLASAGDKAGFADQFKTMAGDCTACHKVYRNR